MKAIVLIAIILSLACCFEVQKTFRAESNLQKAETQTYASTPVKKDADGLKWTCYTCSASCGYGGFAYYCADTYNCVCTFLTTCVVQNIC